MKQSEIHSRAKFSDFNLKKELNTAIKEAGFSEPSPIQQQAIPVVMEGRDIVAQAQTGTGKTAAFGLPLLNMMKCNGKVETVVIVPTRELAIQVSDELFKFGKFLNIKTATVYGGSSYSRQIKHISNASIIVATPGRFLDLLSKEQIKIDPDYVVLDEADEMMDMGFLDDIKEIFKYLNNRKNTLMFSATMPTPIKKLAEKVLNNPEFITITKSEVTNTKIAQSFYVVEEYERDDALIRLFDYKNPAKAPNFYCFAHDSWFDALGRVATSPFWFWTTQLSSHSSESSKRNWYNTSLSHAGDFTDAMRCNQS